MDFKQQILQNKKDKLLEWRDRYCKQDYPFKVIQNLFYDLYADKASWTEIKKCFKTDFLGNSIQQFSNLREAEEYLLLKRRKIQLEKIHPNLESLLEDNVPVTDLLVFLDYVPMIHNAENGSNKDVEEIEYSYVFYQFISDFIFRWATMGLLGKNPSEACYIATEMLSGDANFKSFENVFKTFNKTASTFLSGQGITNEGKKVKIGIYVPLSPLW